VEHRDPLGARGHLNIGAHRVVDLLQAFHLDWAHVSTVRRGCPLSPPPDIVDLRSIDVDGSEHDPVLTASQLYAGVGSGPVPVRQPLGRSRALSEWRPRRIVPFSPQRPARRLRLRLPTIRTRTWLPGSSSSTRVPCPALRCCVVAWLGHITCES